MAVWVIIGGTRGIGLAVGKHLMALPGPNQVVLLGRTEDTLEQAQKQCLANASPNNECSTLPIDATDFDALLQALTSIVGDYGRLDGVVNCAGSLLLKPAHRTSFAEWETTVAQNLTTAFATVRAATTLMQKQTAPAGGSIVLCSSGAARIGLANHEAIAATKAGIEGLVRSAACTYAPKGIRVNAVAPGLTETPLTTSLFSSEMALSASKKMHPLPHSQGRLGTPDDVAQAIVWLLTEQSAWVTGQVIAVDGGLSTLKGA